MLSVVISLWCTFDSAGASWVKMKRYQESVKEREARAGQRRRSGSRRRNWRHRKAMRAYEQSWDRRCKFLFCCVQEERNRNSFTEVAKLFTEFFRDLDVVPSDVLAGLVLLRKHQKLRRKDIVAQGNNDVYQFLSGVAITPATRFLHLKDPEVMTDYLRVVHYMRYALAAYGWPMYMMMNTGTGLCKILPYLNCCCLRNCRENKDQPTEVIEDNCCQCNLVALKKLSGLKHLDLVYVTYHVDIGETPFFIAVDHEHRTVVISIRGTLSLQDVLTDLKADAETLPVDPPKEDWLGHKGMVHAAVYIKKKIKDERLLSQAFGRDLERGTATYELVLVGHSLGAGTAAILAILLHQEYPNLHCYAYSPPGGLLSNTAVQETQNFITSVVVGKDVVPRIGLHQFEALRQDLINMIKSSSNPKWTIIGSSLLCCGSGNMDEDSEPDPCVHELAASMKQDKESRSFLHPSDSQIALTTHTPLYPPGKILHIVRNHPKQTSRVCPCNREKPVYQAIWAGNCDFDEVLISPTMVQDHMPDKVMEALQKVLVNVGPTKPTRKLSLAERKALLTQDSPNLDLHGDNLALNVEEQGECADRDVCAADVCQSGTMSEANSLSWDYIGSGSGSQEALTPEGTLARGTTDTKRKLKLDLSYSLGTDAPLASPETLSDVSSVDSGSWKGSRKCTNGYQRLSTMPTLAPIQQSPQHSRPGYQYFIPVPSPVDYAESPDREFSLLTCQVTPIHHQPPMDETTEESQPDLVSSPHEAEYGDPGDTSDDCQGSAERLLEGWQDDQTVDSIGEADLASYVPHSPDSMGSYNNQLLYDGHLGHYSNAGRGYPHGAYMCDSDEEECSTLSKQFDPASSDRGNSERLLNYSNVTPVAISSHHSPDCQSLPEVSINVEPPQPTVQTDLPRNKHKDATSPKATELQPLCSIHPDQEAEAQAIINQILLPQSLSQLHETHV